MLPYIKILLPLFAPVTDGLELITLILYPVPVALEEGMVDAIVPVLPVDANVPILTGLANDPNAFESCAVKTFPELAVPLAE
jgi:hypothetical protein